MTGDTELFERYHNAVLDIISKERKCATARVYILECAGYIKVGIAAHIPSRVLELQIGNPLPISAIWSSVDLPRNEATRLERRVHKNLADASVSGEWFECSAERAKAAIEALWESRG